MGFNSTEDPKDGEFKKWATDFQEFINSNEARPPANLSSSIKENVHKWLHPSQVLVFSKLFAIHFAMSLVTLSLCPQFGIGFSNSSLIFSFFSSLGYVACMSLCGAFFVLFSLLIASLILKPEEVRAIRSHRFGQLISIGMLSTGFLIFFGAELTLLTWGSWFLGLFVSGILSLELGWKLRTIQLQG